MKLLMIIQRR